MTNIVQKGSAEVDAKHIHKRSAQHTLPTSPCLSSTVEFDRSVVAERLSEKSLFLSSRFSPSSLLCVCLYLCCRCHPETPPPFPTPTPFSLSIVSRPSCLFDVPSVVSCSSQPTEAEQCGDEHPERHQDGKH